MPGHRVLQEIAEQTNKLVKWLDLDGRGRIWRKEMATRPIQADDPRTITLTFNQWKRIAFAVWLELHNNPSLGEYCENDQKFREETQKLVSALGPYNEYLRIWGEKHLKNPLTTP